MLNLYTSPSCASCRKVKKYFDTHQILYTEKNILSHKLTKDDIIKMLMKSENGFEDIISTRSDCSKAVEQEMSKETGKFFKWICFRAKQLKKVWSKDVTSDKSKYPISTRFMQLANP